MVLGGDYMKKLNDDELKKVDGGAKKHARSRSGSNHARRRRV